MSLRQVQCVCIYIFMQNMITTSTHPKVVHCHSVSLHPLTGGNIAPLRNDIHSYLS